ncbi:MAG: sulfite exporter TauE/SafE family protein, partial [Minwuiales bacterium]|nr:sulfite exporter TauE/SafE family protein [Minwuiales bacterium]
MPFDFSALAGLGGPQLPWLALAALGAGLVRGFAGFGAAMIFIPVASALIDPKAAVILLFVIDGIATLPLLVPAVRICRWSEIMPLIVGATLSVPLGVQVLVRMDPVLLRWIICGAILLAVAVMATGWRYSRRPSMPVTVGIGGMA